MEKQLFKKKMLEAKNQFLIQVKEDVFFINTHKKHLSNDLGVVAINEKTGKSTIVLIEDIDAILVDGERFK